MKNFTRRPILAMAAGLFAAVTPAAKAEPDYPNRPIRIIVPFAAGGPTDVVTRRLAEPLAARLGQPIVVENRSGANTLIGTEAALNAAPDGYTIFVTNTQLVQLPALMPNISYDPARDFLPVAQICGVPLILTVNAQLPVRDMRSLVEYLRANPGATSYASTGYGSTANIYGEEFRRTFSLDAEHVPYRGEAPVIPDLLANRVQWFFATPSQVVDHVKSGTLRGLGVTGTQRLAHLPNVPTMGELGAPNFNTVGWFGMFLPVRTPRPIAERISQEVLAVLRDPDFRRFLEDNMFVPQGVGFEEFSQEVARISAVWSGMIRENGIRIQ